MGSKVVIPQKLIKNIVVFFAIFFSKTFFSQEIRLIYNYSYKIDSLNRNEISEELMYLDIKKENSFFSSLPKLSYDSILVDKSAKIGFSGSIRDFSEYRNNSKINFSVSKSFPDNLVIIHEKLGGINYAVSENEKINWKITNETKLLKGIILQKAETYYIGRKWIAWFNTDYPIHDGPYLFKGLPGLILEIYDEKKDHHFNLISILNTENKEFFDDSKNFYNEISVTKLKFNKLWKEYKEYPAKNYLANSGSSNVSVSISVNGISDPREIARQIEKSEKERIKKMNNPINLELFK